MKNIFVVAMLLTLFWAIPAESQTTKNTLELTQITVELNGKKITTEPTVAAALLPDVPTSVLIFKTEDLSYYAEFTYKFKGRRVKLQHRDYIILSDGTIKRGKAYKEMQELKVSVPGAFKGKASNSMLYNRREMSNVFVSYQFTYTYN